MMYPILLNVHSILRYLVIILLLAVIIRSLMGWISKSEFSAAHKKLAVISMSVLHVQFLIGLFLYFISPKVIFNPELFGEPVVRFFTLEHPLLMLIAIIIISVGQIRTKPLTDYHSHKRLFWNHLIGFVIIMVSIPWPFREQLGAGWF